MEKRKPEQTAAISKAAALYAANLSCTKHAVDGDNLSGVAVARINKDDSLTRIARTGKGGKREDYPKEEQTTYKKITVILSGYKLIKTEVKEKLRLSNSLS